LFGCRPIVVWRGEERFGASFLWTLPVDRWRHALAKVFAGWVWLMGGVALFVLWSLALTLLSGGNILAEETLRVLRSLPLSASRTLDPAAWRPSVGRRNRCSGWPLHLDRNVPARQRFGAGDASPLR
jgi:hypothetical protein